MVLGKNFFKRPTLIVAKNLLGKYLARRVKGEIKHFMITEVEAYDGFKDKASHAARGKTKRNAPMFGEAGRWYVYFTYGMHYMLNIVTESKNYPAAILIRGAIAGKHGNKRGKTLNLNGPAKLTKNLKIDKKFNNKIASQKTGLWIADGGVKIKNNKIQKLPRIGISYAGKFWSKKPWRFMLL